MASDQEGSCVSDPNFAVICAFLDKFSTACGINSPTFTELQEMLEDSENVSEELIEMHIKLLRKTRVKVYSMEKWEKALVRFCHIYEVPEGRDIERFGYKKAKLELKVLVLKTLLEGQFDTNTKFKAAINAFTSDELRTKPLGSDETGKTYWMQFDQSANIRVYKEDADEETWAVVASDRPSLVQLINDLSDGSSVVLNDDSSSLEENKPITDTGQTESGSKEKEISEPTPEVEINTPDDSNPILDAKLDQNQGKDLDEKKIHEQKEIVTDFENKETKIPDEEKVKDLHIEEPKSLVNNTEGKNGNEADVKYQSEKEAKDLDEEKMNVKTKDPDEMQVNDLDENKIEHTNEKNRKSPDKTEVKDLDKNEIKHTEKNNTEANDQDKTEANDLDEEKMNIKTKDPDEIQVNDLDKNKIEHTNEKNTKSPDKTGVEDLDNNEIKHAEKNNAEANEPYKTEANDLDENKKETKGADKTEVKDFDRVDTKVPNQNESTDPLVRETEKKRKLQVSENLEEENVKRSRKDEDCENIATKVKASEVSEEIQEPVMIVRGEGSGELCDGKNEMYKDHQSENNLGTSDLNFECSEAIEEDVMYIVGVGSGADCDTGNPKKENDKNQENNDTADVAGDTESTTVSESSYKEHLVDAGESTADKPGPKLWSIDTICGTSNLPNQDKSEAENLHQLQPSPTETKPKSFSSSFSIDSVLEQKCNSIVENSEGSLNESCVMQKPELTDCLNEVTPTAEILAEVAKINNEVTKPVLSSIERISGEVKTCDIKLDEKEETDHAVNYFVNTSSSNESKETCSSLVSKENLEDNATEVGESMKISEDLGTGNTDWELTNNETSSLKMSEQVKTKDCIVGEMPQVATTADPEFVDDSKTLEITDFSKVSPKFDNIATLETLQVAAPTDAAFADDSKTVEVIDSCKISQILDNTANETPQAGAPTNPSIIHDSKSPLELSDSSKLSLISENAAEVLPVPASTVSSIIDDSKSPLEDTDSTKLSLISDNAAEVLPVPASTVSSIIDDSKSPLEDTDSNKLSLISDNVVEEALPAPVVDSSNMDDSKSPIEITVSSKSSLISDDVAEGALPVSVVDLLVVDVSKSPLDITDSSKILDNVTREALPAPATLDPTIVDYSKSQVGITVRDSSKISSLFENVTGFPNSSVTHDEISQTNVELGFKVAQEETTDTEIATNTNKLKTKVVEASEVTNYNVDVAPSEDRCLKDQLVNKEISDSTKEPHDSYAANVETIVEKDVRAFEPLDVCENNTFISEKPTDLDSLTEEPCDYVESTSDKISITDKVHITSKLEEKCSGKVNDTNLIPQEAIGISLGDSSETELTKNGATELVLNESEKKSSEIGEKSFSVNSLIGTHSQIEGKSVLEGPQVNTHTAEVDICMINEVVEHGNSVENTVLGPDIVHDKPMLLEDNEKSDETSIEVVKDRLPDESSTERLLDYSDKEGKVQQNRTELDGAGSFEKQEIDFPTDDESSLGIPTELGTANLPEGIKTSGVGFIETVSGNSEVVNLLNQALPKENFGGSIQDTSVVAPENKEITPKEVETTSATFSETHKANVDVSQVSCEKNEILNETDRDENSLPSQDVSELEDRIESNSEEGLDYSLPSSEVSKVESKTSKQGDIPQVASLRDLKESEQVKETKTKEQVDYPLLSSDVSNIEQNVPKTSKQVDIQPDISTTDNKMSNKNAQPKEVDVERKLVKSSFTFPESHNSLNSEKSEVLSESKAAVVSSIPPIKDCSMNSPEISDILPQNKDEVKVSSTESIKVFTSQNTPNVSIENKCHPEDVTDEKLTPETTTEGKGGVTTKETLFKLSEDVVPETPEDKNVDIREEDSKKLEETSSKQVMNLSVSEKHGCPSDRQNHEKDTFQLENEGVKNVPLESGNVDNKLVSEEANLVVVTEAASLTKPEHVVIKGVEKTKNREPEIQTKQDILLDATVQSVDDGIPKHKDTALPDNTQVNTGSEKETGLTVQATAKPDELKVISENNITKPVFDEDIKVASENKSVYLEKSAENISKKVEEAEQKQVMSVEEETKVTGNDLIKESIENRVLLDDGVSDSKEKTDEHFKPNLDVNKNSESNKRSTSKEKKYNVNEASRRSRRGSKDNTDVKISKKVESGKKGNKSKQKDGSQESKKVDLKVIGESHNSQASKNVIAGKKMDDSKIVAGEKAGEEIGGSQDSKIIDQEKSASQKVDESKGKKTLHIDEKARKEVDDTQGIKKVSVETASKGISEQQKHKKVDTEKTGKKGVDDLKSNKDVETKKSVPKDTKNDDTKLNKIPVDSKDRQKVKVDIKSKETKDKTAEVSNDKEKVKDDKEVELKEDKSTEVQKISEKECVDTKETEQVAQVLPSKSELPDEDSATLETNKGAPPKKKKVIERTVRETRSGKKEDVGKAKDEVKSLPEEKAEVASEEMKKPTKGKLPVDTKKPVTKGKLQTPKIIVTEPEEEKSGKDEKQQEPSTSPTVEDSNKGKAIRKSSTTEKTEPTKSTTKKTTKVIEVEPEKERNQAKTEKNKINTEIQETKVIPKIQLRATRGRKKNAGFSIVDVSNVAEVEHVEDDPLKVTQPTHSAEGVEDPLAVLDDAAKDDKEQQSKKAKKRRNETKSISEDGKTDEKQDSENEDVLCKRLKFKTKRSPDLKLRKSVEEKRQEGDSTSDEDNVEEKIKKIIPRKKGKRKGRPPKSLQNPGTPRADREEYAQSRRIAQQTREMKLLGLTGDVDDYNNSVTEVRQSRRIAQIKMKEDAERRELEEERYKQLTKKSHKKKDDRKTLTPAEKRPRKKKVDSDDELDDEPDEKIGKEIKKKKKNDKLKFNESNPWVSSSGTETEAEEEEEEIEEEPQDEDFVLKSDHEFSPESDLGEDDPDYAPRKRARTAQKLEAATATSDAASACTKCKHSDHPEWILLCDKCDAGWHLSCLRPALMVIPEGDWFCPPCSHASLLENLKDSLKEFDRCQKLRENEELRRKRLAFVGISLNNVLPTKANEGPERPKARSETDVDSDSRSGSESDSDSEPVYQLRERRSNVTSYRYNEYDELIKNAIQDDLDAGKGAANLMGLQTEALPEPVPTAQPVPAIPQETSHEIVAEVKPDSSTVEKTVKPLVVKKPAAKQDDSDEYGGETEDDDEEVEDEEELCDELPPVVPKYIMDSKKKKTKRLKLTTLEFTSEEDDNKDDSDFKGSSSEAEESEYSASSDSDDSDRKRRKNREPLRRSTRARISRYDRDFINDDSEDDAPRRKKSRNIWASSEESTESDASWGRKKKRRGHRPVVTYSRKKSKKGKKSKKNKRLVIESDVDEEEGVKEPIIKKPRNRKIKYGGLDELNEDQVLGRRTRGRKIDYNEANQSESESEAKTRKRKEVKSEDEFVASDDPEKPVIDDEDEEEEEESEVSVAEEEEEENSESASDEEVPIKTLDTNDEKVRDEKVEEKKEKVDKDPSPKKEKSKSKKKPVIPDPDDFSDDVMEEEDLEEFAEELEDLDEEEEEILQELLEEGDIPMKQLKLAVEMAKQERRRKQEAKLKESLKVEAEKKKEIPKIEKPKEKKEVDQFPITFPPIPAHLEKPKEPAKVVALPKTELPIKIPTPTVSKVEVIHAKIPEKEIPKIIEKEVEKPTLSGLLLQTLQNSDSAEKNKLPVPVETISTPPKVTPIPHIPSPAIQTPDQPFRGMIRPLNPQGFRGGPPPPSLQSFTPNTPPNIRPPFNVSSLSMLQQRMPMPFGNNPHGPGQFTGPRTESPPNVQFGVGRPSVPSGPPFSAPPRPESQSAQSFQGAPHSEVHGGPFMGGAARPESSAPPGAQFSTTQRPEGAPYGPRTNVTPFGREGMGQMPSFGNTQHADNVGPNGPHFGPFANITSPYPSHLPTTVAAFSQNEPAVKQRRKPGPKPGSKNKRKADDGFPMSGNIETSKSPLPPYGLDMSDDELEPGEIRNQPGEDFLRMKHMGDSIPKRKGRGRGKKQLAMEQAKRDALGEPSTSTVQAPTQFSPQRTMPDSGSVITRMLNTPQGPQPAGMFPLSSDAMSSPLPFTSNQRGRPPSFRQQRPQNQTMPQFQNQSRTRPIQGGMFHTSHHPLDPSPSGGGPINLPPSTSATLPINVPPSPLKTSHSNSPPAAGFPLNSSPIPFVPPNQTSPSTPARYPPVPETSQRPPFTTPVQGSPNQPRPDGYPFQNQSNFHYGHFPPPQPQSSPASASLPTEDVPPYHSSPFTEPFEDSTIPLSDTSNSKSFDGDNGGEFGGLASYFASQREDDLDT